MGFDPLMDERVSPTVSVERHDSGDPMIIPRGETEAVRYSRASSLANFLTVDSYQLSRWRERYLAQGLGRNRALAMRAGAIRYSTGPLSATLPITARKEAAAELDAICDEAKDYAGINEAADMGTAGHKLTEPGNEGTVPEELAEVIKGYRSVTAGLERVASEVFVANDRLRSAGTFDSAYWDFTVPDWFIVGDTKTGKNYHQAEFEMQLAVYQGGEVYQSDGGRLTFEEYLGRPMHPDVAYLVHVSVTGAPKARIVKLDLARGRRLAELAASIRDARDEVDHVGIGEKLNHRELAVKRLDQLWGELLDSHDKSRITATELREAALALHGRFQDYWAPSMSEEIKHRVENA